jgi:hypothetical protein
MKGTRNEPVVYYRGWDCSDRRCKNQLRGVGGGHVESRGLGGDIALGDLLLNYDTDMLGDVLLREIRIILHNLESRSLLGRGGGCNELIGLDRIDLDCFHIGGKGHTGPDVFNAFEKWPKIFGTVGD